VTPERRAAVMLEHILRGWLGPVLPPPPLPIMPWPPNGRRVWLVFGWGEAVEA
jgi:hypothetical protein